MSLIIAGGTIIDGVSNAPLEGRSIWIDQGRIKAIAPIDDFGRHPEAEVYDATGKYLIPGLMDANVHLLVDFRLENLVRFEGQYEALIAEAAQIGLKSGLTTLFDTWGPLQPLIAVRDAIDKGHLVGSRIFCGGNIVGLGGPFSEDFLPKTLEVASRALVSRINAIWTENVGPELTWMTPDQVASEVRTYLAKGIDFIKYASSEHRVPLGATAFLVFSPAVQAAIVREAHDAGLIAQAHTQSVEALRVAIEAGSDLIQHSNCTGPTPIPQSTLDSLVANNTAVTVFPMTRRRYEWMKANGDPLLLALFSETAVDTNVRNLIKHEARLLLATDAGILAPEMKADPVLGAAAGGEENLFELGQGHFNWLKAMEEKGFPPMEGLKAATRNIAQAYRKDVDLGTLEAGKVADVVVLDKNPLERAEHYRSIHAVLKDGAFVDTSILPTTPLLSSTRSGSMVGTREGSVVRTGTGLPGTFVGCCG
jgi:imidazolonepropionase-like amidohydrolase